jgi:WD40 repeat protein
MRDGVYRVVFSHKGALIAVIGMGYLKVFDTGTGQCRATVDGWSQVASVKSIAFSPDDDLLAAGLQCGTVGVLDVHTGSLIEKVREHTGTVNTVAFSLCGTKIASGADDKTIRILDSSPIRCVCCLEHDSGRVRALCWSTDGTQVISASDDANVRVWDIATRTRSKILYGHVKAVTSVASFNDLVASGSKDGTVIIHVLSSSALLRTIVPDRIVRSSAEPISSVQFSAHGDKVRVMMCTDETKASIYEVGRKRPSTTIRFDGYHAIFSPDGTYVASCSGNFVKIWKVKSGYSRSEAVERHSQYVKDVSFSPDGQLVASQSLGDIKVWNTTSGNCLFTFDTGYTVGFSANSEFVACPSRPLNKHEWTIWDVRTQRNVQTICCNTLLVAISSDGTRIAAVLDPGIRLWSVAAQEPVRLAQLERRNLLQRISKMAFNADGSRIIITTKDGLTKSWAISSAPPNNDSAGSLPMVFSPVHEEWLPQDNRYHYDRDDEWIVNKYGERVLWVPPDRRGYSSDVHGKRVAIGSESGRVYMVDFFSTPVS